MNLHKQIGTCLALGIVVLGCASCEKRSFPTEKQAGAGKSQEKVVRHRAPSATGRPRGDSEKNTARGFDLDDLLAGGVSHRENLERFGTATGAIKDSEEFKRFVEALDKQDFTGTRKTLLFRSALGCLSKEGFTTEALAYVDERFGPGRVRAAMVGRIVAESSLDLADLIKAIEELPYEEERTAAFGGLSSRVRASEFSELLEVLGSAPPRSISKSIGSGIALKFAQPDADVDALTLELDQMIAEVGLNEGFLGGLLDYGSSSTLEAMWKSFEADHEKWPASLRDRYVERFAQLDSKDALTRFASLEGAHSAEIGTIVAQWLRQDSDAAAGVLVDNSLGLGKSDLDVGRFEVVKYSLGHGELDAARRWLSLVEGAELRSKGSLLLQHALEQE